MWPHPGMVSSIAGKIRIPNMSSEPHALRRNEHFCQVTPVYEPESDPQACRLVGPSMLPPKAGVHSSAVQMDPDSRLPPDIAKQFRALHKEYDAVFDPNYGGYNGAVGPFEARVNMRPVEPPQRKGRLPLYPRGRLVELQEKFDALESLGVFKRPEDIGVAVEYLNPSFLVKKPNGGSRLVTAFADVGRYS